MVTLMQRATSGAGSQVEAPHLTPPALLPPGGWGRDWFSLSKTRGHWAEWKVKKSEGQVGADHTPWTPEEAWVLSEVFKKISPCFILIPCGNDMLVILG